MNRGRQDGPSRSLVLRLALLALVVAIPGVAPFGTGALRSVSTGIEPGVPTEFDPLPLLAGGLLVAGGVLVVRSGWHPLGGSADVETGLPTDAFPCRGCGRDLGRYRAKCPHCETREPVAER